MNSSLFDNVVGKSRIESQPAYQQPTQTETITSEAPALVTGEADVVRGTPEVNGQNLGQGAPQEASKVEAINTETSSVAGGGGGSVDMNMLMAHMQSGNMNPAQLQQMMMFMNMQG